MNPLTDCLRTAPLSAAFRITRRPSRVGSNLAAVLGGTTYDVCLNDRAYWRNVPAAVWNYRLGGYQALKKWLSYREERALERALSPDEARLFSEIARRIAAILTLVTER